jgi:hypothetical protein
VGEDPVSDLVRQVQPLGDPQRLLVVPEAAAEALRERGVERLLAGVPERRVAGVVTEPDGLDEILVQAKHPRDDARDPGRLECVCHPRAVVVAGRVDENLRLALETAERLGVDDPVAVALERRPDVGLGLGPKPAACLVRADCERREGVRLQRADTRGESVRDPSGELCHLQSLDARPVAAILVS